MIYTTLRPGGTTISALWKAQTPTCSFTTAACSLVRAQVPLGPHGGRTREKGKLGTNCSQDCQDGVICVTCIIWAGYRCAACCPALCRRPRLQGMGSTSAWSSSTSLEGSASTGQQWDSMLHPRKCPISPSVTAQECCSLAMNHNFFVKMQEVQTHYFNFK